MCETCKNGFYLETKTKCSTCSLPDNCTTSDGKTRIGTTGNCRCITCTANTATDRYYL